jgi:hypothetical protein
MLNKTMMLLSVMFFLAATGVAATASQSPISDDLIPGNSSYDNSSISLIGQDSISSAPADLSVGSGYYLSHPIAVGTGIFSRTKIDNANSAASMSHDVGFAREVSRKSAYTASSTSSRGDYEIFNSATTNMQIDENVNSGIVRIGVLSGEGSAGRVGNSKAGPMNSAWKNPAVEIDQEYIGTYHISNNFTISDGDFKKSSADGWLNCCGGKYITYPSEPFHLRADDVFDCKKQQIP